MNKHMTATSDVIPFTGEEFAARIERAKAAMTDAGLDAIVLTSAANVEYLSGFETQFAWVTPSHRSCRATVRRGRRRRTAATSSSARRSSSQPMRLI